MSVTKFSFVPSFSKQVHKIKKTYDETVGWLNSKIPTLGSSGGLEGAGVDVVFGGTYRKNSTSGEIHARRPWKVFYDDSSTINFNDTVGRAKYIVGSTTSYFTEGGPYHFYSFEWWFPISYSDGTMGSSTKVEWRINDANQSNWETWIYPNIGMNNNTKYLVHGWGTYDFTNGSPPTFDQYSTGIYLDIGGVDPQTAQVAATSTTPIVYLIYDRGNSDEWGTDVLL